MINPQTYRRRNNMRIKNFDYAKNNMFFITMNVSFKLKDQSKKYPIPPNYFGEIINGKMHLNEFGKIAEQQWKWLEDQYKYVRLYEYVVMPDHFHGILEIDRNKIKNSEGFENIKIKPLPQLMGAYKTTSSKLIRRMGFDDFEWHRSFWGNIVFDPSSYPKIANYILNNPAKWKYKNELKK